MAAVVGRLTAGACVWGNVCSNSKNVKFLILKQRKIFILKTGGHLVPTRKKLGIRTTESVVLREVFENDVD